MIEKMTAKEKQFYLPYLSSNQKWAAKSPPSVTFQKPSSHDSMRLKSSVLEQDTPIKTYNGNNLQRYVANHTITKTVPKKNEEFCS